VTQWTAFVGLTSLVITAFLALARLSQAVVRDDASGLTPVSERHHPANDEAATLSSETDGTAEALPRSQVRTSAGATPPQQSLTPGALLANVALTQGLFGAVVLGGVLVFDVPLSALGVPGEPPLAAALAIGCGTGVAFWLGNELASGLADASGADYDERLRGLLAPESAVGWLVLLGGVLPVIAGVEELLFRAAAIGAVTAGYGTSPWALAVVSSVAFAVGHGAQGRVGVAVTGVLGFALAAVYVLSGSLVAVVVAHYLVNALEFLVHEGLGLPDPLWRGRKSG
jgi:membrane protease YdiL (CAAX protease family)